MEQWQAIIENSERPWDQCHRTFEKTLETAAVLLSNAASQLAPFETECLIETLLHSPVELLSTVSQQRGDEVWRKAVADALKLLVRVAGVSDKHYEEIVDTCLLSYDAELRKHALACLAEVAKHSVAGARDIARHIQALEEATQCRAPIALLVGTLCEHHPAVVCDELTRIWRGYLNMLDSNKNTDTVTKAALEGVCSLFKHFGDELPCAELGHFYDKLTHVYIEKSGCQNACYSILAEHATLFRERISTDLALRVKLWGAAPESTLLGVYAVTAQCVDRTALVKILTTEVLPHTESPSYQLKMAALRVLAANKAGFGDLERFADVHTLEYEMRRKVLNADAELIVWCVEYSLPNSERLLQAAILFYDNIPTAVRKKIVVNGIKNSPAELKRAAIQFLISQSCENPESLAWRDLLEDDDAVVLDVVRELADCLEGALESIAEDIEELPQKLSSLLRLASCVPLARACPLRARGPQLRGLARHAAALRAASVLLAGASANEFYKSIRLHNCLDEATLHAACLALVQSPNDAEVESNDMLNALQIIFSSDVEPKIHFEALRKFDYLLSNEKYFDVDIRDAIRSVEKLRERGDRADKYIRKLHREITSFLGKHGNVDMNNNRNTWDDNVIVDLKKTLALAFPYQGTSYKVDLKTMLLLAVQREDASALLTLLAMLCANLSSNADVSTQRATLLTVAALANAHAAGGADCTEHIQQAVRLCGGGATDLLRYISSAKSCGARKLLATALSTLCEETDVLQKVAESCAVMLASSESSIKRAGLDIAETIVTSLENNHALSKTMLPELTTLISKTYESTTKSILKIAFKSFIEKKELFEYETIKKTVNNLLDNLLKANVSDAKIYKNTVKLTTEFIKNLQDVTSDEILDVVFDGRNVNVKMLYILAVLKNEFSFDKELSRKILGRGSCVLLNYLMGLRCENEFFEVEAVLKFIEEYSEVILELKYKETMELLSSLIENFSPALIKELQNNINQCFTSLKTHWINPKTIITSIQSWLNTIPIKKITGSIEKEIFTEKHHLYVEALKIMSNIFDMTNIMTSDVKMLFSRWPKILMEIFSSDRLEEYYYEEMSYFNDMLHVSLKFLTEDVKKIIISGSKKINSKGVSFCEFFIKGLFEVLVEKPFILLDEELKECSLILNDIVRLAAKKNSLKEHYENVKELVDKLWPTYEQHSTFVQKHCLLVNLQCLGPGPDSNPLQWVRRIVCLVGESLDHRTKLLCFLPDETLMLPEVMASVSSLFPARCRELHPALLEAVALHPAALLPTAATLANNDASTGWWDTALESCVAAAAKRNNLELCETLFQKCGERACERVLVPLLRHSSTELCERFLASTLDRLLGNLKKRPKGKPEHPGYRKCWEDYMCTLYLLLVAFEKLPTPSLESPTSILYSQTAKAPWHLVRETCTFCHQLREILYSPAKDHMLYPMYRKLQCLIYNTHSAAICRRRPPALLYEQLLSQEALSRLMDDREYVLPIRASWTQRTKTLPVAVHNERSTLSLSNTQRSRIFLRTLSEDPMLFDLHSSEEDTMEVQDISLTETPLNSHPCAGTLTALLRHCSTSPALNRVWPVVGRLLEARTNLKWLVAQVVCNCREELSPHASELLPGLLALLASAENGKFNGLHMDVLDTLLLWKQPTTSDHLNTITHNLITTCMEHRHRNVFDGSVRTLHGVLEVYGSVRIEWRSFETYYEDQNPETQKALFKLIQTISKTKYIPQILSKIIAKLDTNPAKLAECFGLAMSVCDNEDEKRQALGEFRRYLKNCNVITSYIRVLYYGVLGSAECCGEQEFRKIADYVNKVTSSDRTKCLHILSASSRCHYDIFDTIDLSHMIDKDHAALLLVKNCLHLMEEGLKRRCVSQVAALRPTSGKVKKMVLGVIEKAYQELFASPPQPPAKRQKTDTTPILSISRDDIYANSILTCLGTYAVDSDAEVASVAREVLMVHLDKDLGARFAECFLLTVYVPAHTDTPAPVCVCVCAVCVCVLRALLRGVRGAEGFQELRLREEPLPVREDENSRLLTLSRTFQGTFGSYSARGRTRTQGRASTTAGTGTNTSAIDVQVPIDSILQTLLDFAKTTPEAARSLLTEVLRSVLSTSKFDISSTLIPLLGTLLGRTPTELTPLYIDVCRVLAAGVGLLPQVGSLRASTAGSEGARLTSLLYEEVAMRCLGDPMFQLGQPEDMQDIVMNETSTFSIEDLKLAFGKLSNWDDLTLQQKSGIKNTLPPLWSDRGDFIAHLDSYQVPEPPETWFDKLSAAYKRQTTSTWRWLQDQWPRKPFGLSAATEALSWHEAETASRVLAASGVLEGDQCLAEWAARLMIRSLYYNLQQHSESDDTSRLSRSHELKWCMRANEMGIPNAVLQCVERNVELLNGDETLSWLRQKLLALRQKAWEGRNDELLRDVLKKAEKYTPEFLNDPTVCIEMYHLTLLLHKDLKSLQHDTLQSILVEVDRTAQQVEWGKCSKKAVGSIFEVAIGHYDEMLEVGTAKECTLRNRCVPRGEQRAAGGQEDMLRHVVLSGAASTPPSSFSSNSTAKECTLRNRCVPRGAAAGQEDMLRHVVLSGAASTPPSSFSSNSTMDTEEVLSNISQVISLAATYDTPKTDLLLAVLLNRLNNYEGQMESGATRALLDKLGPLLPTLDAFSIELLQKNIYKFPSELHRTLAAMFPKDDNVEKYRKCLQLICDPNHLLMHYCEELVLALRDKDPACWKSTLNRMRGRIYENPYAGPSFKLLDKYKDDLYGMYDFEPTTDFATRAESKLKSIVLSLRRDPQATLRLSDLCPALLRPIDGAGVEKWFGLKGVKIVKFFDKVQVFTDSIRRPCVVSVLLSCGRVHRALHKTGERLASDAAAQRVAVAALSLPHVAYSVTLLDEESAVIEFLENHERLRTMIASSCNLEVLHTVSRPADALLVETPAQSLQAHTQLCARVPSHALRSAIEQNSSCVQDFIWKKQNFTESLADMTLLTWLLGLGDRHLQNILWSRDGTVRGVDFGDVWRRSAEPPARLARNILAVADTQVLEARLQRSLAAMRDSAIVLEAAIRVAFHWLGDDLENQMRQVRGILRGLTSSYDVTRDVTNNSQLKYKDKYVQLLDRVLGDSRKDHYSVQDQVSCLLRHCTSPELLSVVRSGWEPWV